MAHRLLKNNAAITLGSGAYALFTAPVVERFERATDDALPMPPSTSTTTRSRPTCTGSARTADRHPLRAQSRTTTSASQSASPGMNVR